MTLQRIEVTPLTDLLREIIVARSSGRLTVVTREIRKSLYWSQGELILAVSSDPRESLAEFLVQKELVSRERSANLAPEDPTEVIPVFDNFELPERANRNSVLRSWTAAIVQSLFSLEAGTAAFSDEDPLEPSRRVFVSTASIVLDGVRSISSGLSLRSSLGDLKREIEVSDEAPFSVTTLPLTKAERTIAEILKGRMTIDAFLKSAPGESVLAARVAIAMMTLGVFVPVDPRVVQSTFDDTERDLATLAAIGGDRRALQVVAFAKRVSEMDHYEVLDVPKAATRTQILLHADEQRQRYDPTTYPPAAQSYAKDILEHVESAVKVLADADKRAAYDKAVASRSASSGSSVQQKLARRNLAMENYRKAEELFVREDFYGAIVLLQQSVKFAPDHAKSWNLLGICQQKNPRWKRQAIESFHRALSIDPNQIETMIALGDLYAAQTMNSRARSFYEDALKVDPGYTIAKVRLKKLGK